MCSAEFLYPCATPLFHCVLPPSHDILSCLDLCILPSQVLSELLTWGDAPSVLPLRLTRGFDSWSDVEWFCLFPFFSRILDGSHRTTSNSPLLLVLTLSASFSVFCQFTVRPFFPFLKKSLPLSHFSLWHICHLPPQHEPLSHPFFFVSAAHAPILRN